MNKPESKSKVQAKSQREKRKRNLDSGLSLKSHGMNTAMNTVMNTVTNTVMNNVMKPIGLQQFSVSPRPLGFGFLGLVAKGSGPGLDNSLKLVDSNLCYLGR